MAIWPTVLGTWEAPAIELYFKLDEHGEAVWVPDVAAWAPWFEQARADGRTQLALTNITPAVKVSTVFLGLNHNLGGAEPVLWETLVFGGVLDGEQRRYTTRTLAAKGHDGMVRRVQRAAARATAQRQKVVLARLPVVGGKRRRLIELE